MRRSRVPLKGNRPSAAGESESEEVLARPALEAHPREERARADPADERPLRVEDRRHVVRAVPLHARLDAGGLLLAGLLLADRDAALLHDRLRELLALG